MTDTLTADAVEMTDTEVLEDFASKEYKYGFVTDIETDDAPPGLDESTIAFISNKKGEPEWLLAWRLKAFANWQKMEDPTRRDPSQRWAMVDYPEIDYQAISYYSAPKKMKELASLDEVDPELLRTYEKLGIPLEEQMVLSGVLWTPSSTVSPWPPPSRRSSASSASSSVRSPRRFTNTPTW